MGNNWVLFRLKWAGAGPELERAGTIKRRKWPLVEFEAKAKALGYTELEADSSILIGGYYTNPNTGESLILVNEGEDPSLLI